MAITIKAPAPAVAPYKRADSSDESDNGGADLQGDISMRPGKRVRHNAEDIVTPGEIVTDDSQWMRLLNPFEAHRLSVLIWVQGSWHIS